MSEAISSDGGSSSVPQKGKEERSRRAFDWIVFDFGGVVYTNSPSYLQQGAPEMEALAQSLGVESRSALKKRVYSDSLEWGRAKIGKMSSKEFFASIFTSLGVTDEEEILRHRETVQHLGKWIDPKMIQLVKDLRSAGYKISMLSNYEDDLRSTIQQRENMRAIEELFDLLVISGETGVAKPSGESYADALRQMGVEDAGRVLFIDDKKRNVDAAIGCGWVHSLLFTSTEQCDADVRKATGLASSG